jgi:type 1 glutamine amidotransferase
VDVTYDPEEVLSDWDALRSYSLLFTDYFGPDWGEVARSHFARAIREGMGLVVLHAANNAFPDWDEYKQIIALTFEKSVSGHGDYHEFEVSITDSDHPITRGLTNFRTHDELYHRMVPAEGVSYKVLSTAYSDPSMNGTGEREPMMIILHYGMGRVFHLMLGHVWPTDFNKGYLGYQMLALENKDFQICLTRGAEWAATGKVR